MSLPSGKQPLDVASPTAPPAAAVVAPGDRARVRRWLLGGVGLLAAALLALGLVGRSGLWHKDQSSPEADPLALPPVSSSPFLNTKPDAHYVGSDACRSCHRSQDASYRRTGMGRSMAE